ncbi:unnamed protein product [Nippostrongylus brasiliensis]|uniref:Conserved secreted protein n=1 Tax=Nippostrongylus brasiliensis TaxID=27835 RepID=A0A0N4Y6Q6_NIPBR|nr:unnamed protein product [Nippostrongylus brasiliensis]
MRCNIRRIFTLAFVAFGATLVLLSLPRDNFGREWDEAPRSSELEQFRDASSAASGLRAARVGPQMSFQKQPNPPSLIRKKTAENPFDFTVHINRPLLNKLHSYIKGRDLDSLTDKECHINTTLAEYWLKTKQKSVPTRDPWEKFYAQIGSCNVYSDDQVVDELLGDLNEAAIKTVHIMDGGTQVSVWIVGNVHVKDLQEINVKELHVKDCESASIARKFIQNVRAASALPRCALG